MNELFLFLAIFFGLLGPFVGSFFALIVGRQNTKEVVTQKYRSQCLHCKRPLLWYELIPIFSFLLLRGKCRTCDTVIDIRLWFAELMGALAFLALSFVSMGLATGAGSLLLSIMQLLFVSMFIVFLLYSAIYDLLTMTIEARITVFFLLGSLILAIGLNIVNFLTNPDVLVIPFLASPDNLIAALVGALALWLLIRVSNQRAMGEGDIYIVAVIGLYLGLIGLGVALYFAVITGAIAGVLYALRIGKLKGVLVPFVPFLLIGSSLSIMLGKQLMQLFFYVGR